LDSREKQRWSERLSEWLRSVFFIPDARILWLFFAVRLGKKILKQEKIDLIFSSAPPYTTHLIGYRLKRASGLPWVVDFRDSWIGWLSTPQWRPKISRNIELKMEAAVLQHADVLLSATAGVRQDLLSRHRHLDNRWHLLLNGYDPADFSGVAASAADVGLMVTYIGSLYGHRNPEYLIQALELFRQSNDLILHDIKIRIVGRVGAPIRERIRNSGVADKFEFKSYVTHKESLSYLLGSDVALLIIDDSPANAGILTGKIFEYIGAGKVILALAPEGEAAALIRNNALGLVVKPDDVPNIQAALQELRAMKQNRFKDFVIDRQLQKQFDRKEQTRELAQIFNSFFEN
jgi:glycosyltransferase involved in cell wall biosynthesis